MPVLDTERAPTRSALRYRPRAETDQAQSRPGPLVARRSRVHADSHTPAAKVVPDDLDLEEEERPPSRHRAVAPIPRQGTDSPARVRRRFHPFFWLGAGLLVSLLIWAGMTQALNWGNNTLNTLHYGYPRTFQLVLANVRSSNVKASELTPHHTKW